MPDYPVNPAAIRRFALSRLPHSTNRLFYNEPGKGRTKTSKYRSWRIDAAWELRCQGIKPLRGPVSVSVTLPDMPGRAPDLDNTAKALIDLLVIQGIIEADDKKILRSLSLRWDRKVANTIVLIEGADDEGA